jgi:hypothetical protein
MRVYHLQSKAEAEHPPGETHVFGGDLVAGAPQAATAGAAQ